VPARRTTTAERTLRIGLSRQGMHQPGKLLFLFILRFYVNSSPFDASLWVNVCSVCRIPAISFTSQFAAALSPLEALFFLVLDRLATAQEAVVIREVLGIRKRRRMTAEALSGLEPARDLLKRPI
jgi:hypothetical protein